MKYVIKNKRLAKFLYCLGFDYVKVKDKQCKNRYIYLYTDSILLRNSIEFYNNIRNKNY